MAYQTTTKSKDATFGDKPSYASAYNFDYGPSDDRKAFTITFNGFESSVGNAKDPKPVSAQTFSIVLPVNGGGPVRTTLAATGFGLTTEGANATMQVTVNGDTEVLDVGPGFDGEIIHKISIDRDSASELRITFLLLTERDSAFPDASAFLNITTIDADLMFAPPGM